MKRAWARLAALLVGAFVLTGTGSAYYYYYFTANGTLTLVKFDTSALVNSTVPFYISDSGPSAVVSGDSFQAVVSEVRAAAEVWNTVPTSTIRLAYGGLFTEGRSDTSPSIDVHFSNEVPPGLLAVGGPESLGSVNSGSATPFYSITRSQLLLPADMTNIPYYGATSSYSEQFFVTLVHEFGHTLGLQHSLTSSVMSTLTTSASSKAAPLAQDDISGISLLYPTAGFASTIGSITGKVTMNGNGVNLASVVAISPSNPAIAALTNPDGSYQINGVPPGQYFVYVHPLPPPLSVEATYDNLIYPRDGSNNAIPPNYTAFVAQFYTGASGGTRNWQQAQILGVTSGNATGGINFNVTSETSSAVTSVRTYGYTQAGLYVSPAPITLGISTPMLVAATGSGLLQSNNTVTPGLAVGTLGTVVQLLSPVAYPPPQPYIALYVQQTSFGISPGPKHLLFSTPSDLYVLPSGFSVVNDPPPSITSVTPTYDKNGNRAVTIVGTALHSDTRILFDGLQGVAQAQPDGSLLVTPPQAPSGYIAPVVALNSDGQSSLFLQQTPPTFTYDSAGAPSLTVSPSTLTPGSDITVTITGVNTNFLAGQTTPGLNTRVGFGTSDVIIRSVSVQSPTQMSVVVTPNASVSTNKISVTTGLSIVSQALGAQVTATDTPPTTH